VATSDYSTGPWADCAFAGCRGECASNMRPIVEGLDVRMDLGGLDPVSGVCTRTPDRLTPSTKPQTPNPKP